MSLFGSSAARSRIFAQISFAFSSRTSEPSQIMRSFSSWSKTFCAIRGSGILAPFGVALIRHYRRRERLSAVFAVGIATRRRKRQRSEEHTSELQSRENLV